MIYICLLSSQVLATDNAHHFEHMGELKSTLEAGMDPGNNAKHLTILLNIALHAADVSNPTKPFETYVSREVLFVWRGVMCCVVVRSTMCCVWCAVVVFLHPNTHYVSPSSFN